MCSRWNNGKKRERLEEREKEQTAPRRPAWSPTVVPTWHDAAYFYRADVVQHTNIAERRLRHIVFYHHDPNIVTPSRFFRA